MRARGQPRLRGQRRNQTPIGSESSRLTDADPRLLDALASLNQIGAAIQALAADSGSAGSSSASNRSGESNRLADGLSEAGGGEAALRTSTLRLVVESAAKIVPGAAAVVYTCDPARHAFDLISRVSAGGPDDPTPADFRPDDIEMRAIARRRRILSYEKEDLAIQGGGRTSSGGNCLARVQAGAKAMACFPLLVADQPVGVLCVYLHQDRRFSQLELLMLENLVNQAAMVIYQTRRLRHAASVTYVDVQRDLARKEDELNRLRRAGLLISSRLGLHETLEAILHMALDVTSAHYGIFRLVDESGQSLITRAIAGDRLARPLVEALPIDGHSVMGWVAQHRQPVLIHDLHTGPWSHIYYPLDADLEMRSELAVPLIGASGRLEGVLNLESPAVGAFDERDRHLLQALATQAVIAIQEVRLLDALQEVARLLFTHPCQQVLRHLADLACDLLNAAASAIWTLQGDQLVLEIANAGYRRGERLPLHGSLAGQAILQCRPLRSDDVRTDPRFHRPDLACAQNWMQALVVPLLASGERDPAADRASDRACPERSERVPRERDAFRAIGAFSVYSTGSAPGRLAESEWDEKVLTCLARYAVLAVHNAARQEALRVAQERHAVAETFAAVGDIAANLLHQLNNKVGTIPVRVQGIQDKCKPALLADLYLAANLEEIERSAHEAMEAVRENLSHLRPIHLSLVEVASCVRVAVDAARLPPGISVQVQDLDGLPAVMAGERSLTLVFTNLLQNAADAMCPADGFHPPGRELGARERGKGEGGEGSIILCGAAHGGWVEVTVSDSGPGIAPELHERIFEFDDASRASTRAGKLGFGLWWVKTLMVRLGGTIAVHSDGRHGTTFRLRLPCAGERSESVGHACSVTPGQDG